MVRRCRAVGVDIYADVVLNHMTAGDGVGSAGTTYVKYEYGALYGPEDFHAHPNPDDPGVLCDRSIANYREPTEVRTCELRPCRPADRGRRRAGQARDVPGRPARARCPRLPG